MLGLKLLKMMLVSSVLALCFYTPANADVSVSVGPGGTGLYVGSSYARPVVAAPMPPPPSRYYYRPYRGYHYAPPPPPPHHHHHHHHHHGPHHGYHHY